MLEDLIVIALAAAFVIAAVERWVDLQWTRGFLAWGAGTIGSIIFHYEGADVFVVSMGAGFAALAVLLLVDKASQPPVIQVRRPDRTAL